MADGYQPSDVVVGLHTFYRMNKDPSINDAILGDGDAWTEYVSGIAFAPGIFGIVVLLSMLMLCCKCCCCKTRSYDDYRTMDGSRGTCVRVVVGMLVTLLLVATLTASKGGYDLNHGLHELRSSLDDIQDTIKDLDDNVNDLQADGTAVREAAKLCPKYADQIEKELVFYFKYIDQAHSYTQPASDMVVEIDPYEQQIFSWLIPAFAVPLVLLLLSTVFVCMGTAQPSSCWCSLKLGLYLAVPALLVLWFTTTVQMVFTIPTADYCMQPDNTTLTVFEKLSRSSDNDLAVQVFKSYIDCESNVTNPVMDPLQKANLAMKALIDLIPIFKGAKCPAKSIEGLVNATTKADNVLQSTIKMIDCSNINAMYRAALHVALCTDVENGAVWLWANGLVTFVILVLLVWQAMNIEKERIYPRSANGNYR